MFSIKTTLISFYNYQHFYLSNQFWIIISLLNNKNLNKFIFFDSQIILPIISIIFTLITIIKTLLLSIVFSDFYFLGSSIFQVIHCDNILNNTNISNSTLGIENDGPSFILNNSTQTSPNADNSWAMTTIRPHSPNDIANFSSETETIPDMTNTNLRSRNIVKIVIFSVGGSLLIGIIITFSVLASTHSL